MDWENYMSSKCQVNSKSEWQRLIPYTLLFSTTSNSVHVTMLNNFWFRTRLYSKQRLIPSTLLYSTISDSVHVSILNNVWFRTRYYTQVAYMSEKFIF